MLLHYGFVLTLTHELKLESVYTDQAKSLDQIDYHHSLRKLKKPRFYSATIKLFSEPSQGPHQRLIQQIIKPSIGSRLFAPPSHQPGIPGTANLPPFATSTYIIHPSHYN